MLAGARALLVQAGLPSGFWPLAVQCYCHLENVSLQEKEGDPAGTSPWFRRHAEHFPGMQIPFGAGVYYLPSGLRNLSSNADPRMRYGVFVGYRLKPGSTWSGEYLVYDLDVFLNKDLGVGADVSWGRMVRNPQNRLGALQTHYASR